MHIVLINPKFEISFWGLEYTLPFFGKSATMPVAGLPLLAALTPPGHKVTIIDENVEPIDFDLCARADFVGITGMSVQRLRVREILSELKRRGATTVVGGPWVTVKEDYFEDLADTIFVGEAEETWPQFLEDFARGCAARRYEQKEKTDLTKVPPPRLDLLKMKKYTFGSIQFSRGCPFTCEFCDIIVVFGRKPRIKTPAQIIAELEGLRAQKQSIVFIVDDNLIGNKKATKETLRHVIEWQKANGYPFDFVTEASIDLADDPELLDLMAEAHIVSVFVGIESPNEAALRETRKVQNVRAGNMIEKIHRIQNAGMEVWAGMIVGFDNDDETVFEAHHEFLRQARINTAMVGMLSAIPKTPLYSRLQSEGRLDPADSPAHGTNVIPLRMSRETLTEGYVGLMKRLYEPKAYFDRLDDLYISGRMSLDRFTQKRSLWGATRYLTVTLVEALGVLLRVLIAVPDRSLRREYLRRVWSCIRARRPASVLYMYAIKCAIHVHMHRLVQALAARERPIMVNTI